ncbi:hypothetical protein AGMMS49957_06150 [Synergistales bacterium]|nr:hypothetical protein AGMMS49957_06150 [Synergistales bacterium]
MKLRAKKGFTLVELLIVIVIIGILVGAMLLSSGSATATAKASAALSELRGLKAAVIVYMADHGGSAPVSGIIKAGAAGGLGDIATMVDNPAKFSYDQYTIVYSGDVASGGALGDVILVAITVSNDVAQKLIKNAEQSGLLDATGNVLGTTVGGGNITFSSRVN